MAATGYELNMAAAKRSRKRHVQQDLFRRGGKRKGAGRKPKGTRPGAPHKKRDDFKSDHPLHIVLHVVPAVGKLRRRVIYKAIRDATITTAMRGRIRIIHLSIQRTHVHMLVEAKDKQALARGMQGFQISAARNINTALGADKYRRRRGAVFADRYHAVPITSPTQARHAISYILNNWRKHREDRSDLTRTWELDWFSSAATFPDWKEYGAKTFLLPSPPGYEPLLVYRPETWLLSDGWKRTGTISTLDVPSRRR